MWVFDEQGEATQSYGAFANWLVNGINTTKTTSWYYSEVGDDNPTVIASQCINFGEEIFHCADEQWYRSWWW
jgi:hypothetical protein